MCNFCMAIFLSLLLVHETSFAKDNEIRAAPIIMRSLNCSDDSSTLQRVEAPTTGRFDFKWLYRGNPISSIIYSNPHPTRFVVEVHENTRNQMSIEETADSIVEEYTVDVVIKEVSRFASHDIKEVTLTCRDVKYLRMPLADENLVPLIQ